MKNNIHILEPCCIHKQLHEIVQYLKEQNSPLAVAYHFGDCSFKQFLSFAADFAAKSNVIIATPYLSHENTLSIAETASLTFKPNASSQLEKRFESVRIIANNPSGFCQEELIGVKNCFVANYNVAQTVIALYNSNSAITIIGSMPDNIALSHYSYNLVTVSRDLSYTASICKTLLPLFKKHQIKL